VLCSRGLGRVSGRPFGFLIKVYVEAVDRLEDILDRFLPYGQTTTSIVQSSPVPRRSLPLSSRSQISSDMRAAARSAPPGRTGR
jgi:hypothetical protein